MKRYKLYWKSKYDDVEAEFDTLEELKEYLWELITEDGWEVIGIYENGKEIDFKIDLYLEVS